jgi:hypothetical protein
MGEKETGQTMRSPAQESRSGPGKSGMDGWMDGWLVGQRPGRVRGYLPRSSGQGSGAHLGGQTFRRVMADPRAPFLPKGGRWESIGGQQRPLPVRKQQMSSLWAQEGHQGGPRGPLRVVVGRRWASKGCGKRLQLASSTLLFPFRMAYGIPSVCCGPRGSLSVVPSILSASVPSALVIAANDAAAPGHLHTAHCTLHTSSSANRSAKQNSEKSTSLNGAVANVDVRLTRPVPHNG